MLFLGLVRVWGEGREEGYFFFIHMHHEKALVEIFAQIDQ
jgi:hypothetical protein